MIYAAVAFSWIAGILFVGPFGIVTSAQLYYKSPEINGVLGAPLVLPRYSKLGYGVIVCGPIMRSPKTNHITAPGRGLNHLSALIKHTIAAARICI